MSGDKSKKETSGVIMEDNWESFISKVKQQVTSSIEQELIDKYSAKIEAKLRAIKNTEAILYNLKADLAVIEKAAEEEFKSFNIKDITIDP